MATITYTWKFNGTSDYEQKKYSSYDAKPDGTNQKYWGSSYAVANNYICLSANSNYNFVHYANGTQIDDQFGWGTSHLLEITGDTGLLASKITKMQFITRWVNSAGSGMNAGFAIVGNGGAISQYSGSEWVGGSTSEQAYNRTVNIDVNGAILNNFLGVAMYGSASSSYLRLRKDTGKLTQLILTFTPLESIKYYNGTDFVPCQTNYYNGSSWKPVYFNRWNGSSWEQV